jgi:hypothetical protein
MKNHLKGFVNKIFDPAESHFNRKLQLAQTINDGGALKVD